jgi:AMP nucleosidase
MESKHDLQPYFSAQEAYLAIEEIYEDSVSLLKDAYSQITDLSKIFSSQELIDLKHRLAHEAVYPYIEFQIHPENLYIDPSIAYGIALETGRYGTTITQPKVFNRYLIEQLSHMMHHHQSPVFVGKSDVPIPISFVLESALVLPNLDSLTRVKTTFSNANIQDINDNIANGLYRHHDACHPLSLFSALRTDYSLSRLHHYTGTHPSHFQNFILLTNYHRYVENFSDYALSILGDEDIEFVEPGNHITRNINGVLKIEGEKPHHLPQMPAYHLKRKDGNGITFINIGVGPSNAKNITDNLAVLRPHCWLMLGHCAGLRRSQALGDYVLAHGYVRHDHVLDSDLPPWINIPPLAEIQVALQEAVSQTLGLNGPELKAKLRTGTVLGTDNRNWELQYDALYETFQQHRAIAVDMESATLAANGFRFRVPYGTLLCVSDKPLHGELKLKGTANAFYNDRIHQHLEIGLKAIDILRSLPLRDIHSRKLRGFEEPPFR